MIIKSIFSGRKKFIALAIILIVIGFLGWKVFGGKKETIQYQTALAERGTLITSISGSGTITSGNYTNITTKTSGTVGKVYVINGDKVIKGQKIAEINLDEYAQERQTAAWVTYLEAVEAVKEAQKAKVSADIQMWKDRESVLNAQEDVNNNKGDTEGEKMIVSKTLDETRLAFNLSESKYLNSDADIANAKAKVSAALRTYQENSAVIIAPSAGVISDLALAEGITVSANSTTSSTSGATIVSSQTVGKINDPSGQLVASVALSEIDITSVKANQKVTVTLDAYPDNSFTGKVLAVNTSGNVNSGVTSYPVTILLDQTAIDIYPNMAVSAQIITNIKTEVILVPTTAVTTAGGQSSLQIMKDGKPTKVAVEIGLAGDSQTEIVSGINEGDEIITSTINSVSTTKKTTTTTSPFSGSGNRMIIQEGPRGF